jgi:AcrR family transcriptional regulator
MSDPQPPRATGASRAPDPPTEIDDQRRLTRKHRAILEAATKLFLQKG